MSPSEIYYWLMRYPANKDDFDRHVLASALSFRQALGLSHKQWQDLLGEYFPHARASWQINESSEAAIEEADLAQLLLAHQATGRDYEKWLAQIIARRCQEPNHLWQDLGLRNRGELSRLLERNFPSLAAQNQGDMKWKKFFYRKLCQAEGVPICKSPVCDICCDFSHCFGGEDGLSLIAQGAREWRNSL